MCREGSVLLLVETEDSIAAIRACIPIGVLSSLPFEFVDHVGELLGNEIEPWGGALAASDRGANIYIGLRLTAI